MEKFEKFEKQLSDKYNEMDDVQGGQGAFNNTLG
jgi:hypothetical protein